MLVLYAHPFFIVGFLAELIVNQNERVDDLEASLNDLAAENAKNAEKNE